MNDALVVGVLHRVADPRQQFEARGERRAPRPRAYSSRGRPRMNSMAKNGWPSSASPAS